MFFSLIQAIALAALTTTAPGATVHFEDQLAIVKKIHSHNDYLQPIPLHTALSFGAGSVEVDVWALDNLLYVGHSRGELKKDRTFDLLYVQPLLKILKEQRDTNATALSSLQVLIDMKTSGKSTFNPVVAALAPLRDAGFLTTFKDGVLRKSIVTVVGTGDTPIANVQALSPRDFFFDSPLTTLTKKDIYIPALSPLASADYSSAVGWNGKGTIGKDKLAKLVKLVGDAHTRGLETRFWNTPAFPVDARNAVWKVLIENGADWLNVDDLKAASEF